MLTPVFILDHKYREEKEFTLRTLSPYLDRDRDYIICIYEDEYKDFKKWEEYGYQFLFVYGYETTISGKYNAIFDYCSKSGIKKCYTVEDSIDKINCESNYFFRIFDEFCENYDLAQPKKSNKLKFFSVFTYYNIEFLDKYNLRMISQRDGVNWSDDWLHFSMIQLGARAGYCNKLWFGNNHQWFPSNKEIIKRHHRTDVVIRKINPYFLKYHVWNGHIEHYFDKTYSPHCKKLLEDFYKNLK